MQIYGKFAWEDNSEVGEAALDRCSIFCIYTRTLKLPAEEAKPQLSMGPSNGPFTRQYNVPSFWAELLATWSKYYAWVSR